MDTLNLGEYNFSELIVNYFKEYFPELQDENNFSYQSTLDEIKSTIKRWKKSLRLEITGENIYEFFDLVMNMKLCNLDLKEISKKDNINYYINLFEKLQEYAYERYYKKSIESKAIKNNIGYKDAYMDIELQKRKYVISRGHSVSMSEKINNIWNIANNLSYIIIMNSKLNDRDLKVILRVYDLKGNKIDTMKLLYIHQEQVDLIMGSKRLDIDEFISIEKSCLEKGETLTSEDINKNACYRNMYLYLIEKYLKQICESEIKWIEELDKDYKYNIHDKDSYNLSDISQIIYNSQINDTKRNYSQIYSSIKDSFKDYGLDEIFKTGKNNKYFIRKEEVELCLAYYEYISNRKLKKTNFSEILSFEKFEKIRNQIISVRAKTNHHNKETYDLVKEFQIMISNSIHFILNKINAEMQFSKLEQIEDELAHIKFIIYMKLLQLNKGR